MVLGRYLIVGYLDPWGLSSRAIRRVRWGSMGVPFFGVRPLENEKLAVAMTIRYDMSRDTENSSPGQTQYPQNSLASCSCEAQRTECSLMLSSTSPESYNSQADPFTSRCTSIQGPLVLIRWYPGLIGG